MCGIVGIVDFKNNQLTAKRYVLASMLDTITHQRPGLLRVHS